MKVFFVDDGFQCLWSSLILASVACGLLLMGSYDCKFVEIPSDKLVCQICLLVAHSPHQMTCCGRVYCKACPNQYRRHCLNCRNCRKRGHDFPDISDEWTSGHSLKKRMLYNFPLKSLSLGEQEINWKMRTTTHVKPHFHKTMEQAEG